MTAMPERAGISLVPMTPEVDPKEVNPFSGRLRVIDDYIRERKQFDWVVEQLCWRGSIGMLFGESGTGKSFVALDLLAALASGAGAWCGDAFAIPRPRRVLYAAGEGRFGLPHRLYAVRQYYAAFGLPIPPEAFLLLDGVPMLFDQGVPENVTNFIAACLHLADDGHGPLDLVVIDTLSWATLGSDDNSNDDAMFIAQSLQRISHELGCAVILVHHTNKAGELRGASNYRNVLDFIWQVKPDRTLECYKAKETDFFKPLSFNLEPQEAIDGETSCTVGWVGIAERATFQSLRDRLVEFHAQHASGDRFTAREIASILSDACGKTINPDKVRMRIESLINLYSTSLADPNRAPSNLNPRVYVVR